MTRYYVYKVTNKINGKIYIGRSLDFFRRIAQHCKESEVNNQPLHLDFKEYGIQNFTWEVLCIVDTKEEADKYERQYILEYNCVEPFGYNKTLGGTGGVQSANRHIICFTKDGEIVKKYESASQAAQDGFFIHGVIDCCEHKATRCHDNVFMYEDEYIEKGFIRKAKDTSACYRPVIQCDLNGNKIAEFKSVVEASRETGCKRPNISSCLTGKQKTVKGFIFVYKEDFPIKNLNKYSQKTKGIKVASLNAETNKIVSIYNSIAEAGRDLGVNYKAIQKVLNVEGRTAYGYKWISL